MFTHYLKIALRNLLKNKVQSVISIIGLAVAFVCVTISAMWIRYDTTYDTSHPNAKDIYHVLNGHKNSDFVGLYSPYILAEKLKQNFDEVEAATAVHHIDVKERDNYDEIILYNNSNIGNFCDVDAGFFDVFSVFFILGDKNSLANDQSVILAESKAKQLFGSASAAMGAKLTIQSQHTGDIIRECTVTGVVKDFEHSTIKFNALKKLIPEDKDNRNTWCAYRNYFVYIRFITNANISAFAEKFYNTDIDECMPGKFEFRYQIAPISKVPYMYSKKSVMPFVYIIILSVISLLLFICALFNHLALFISFMLTRLRNIGLRKAIGSSNKQLFTILLTEFLFTIVIAFLLGVCVLEFLRPDVENFTQIYMGNSLMLSMILLFGIAGIIISVIAVSYPIWRICKAVTKGEMTGKKPMGKQYTQKVLIVIQLIISIFFISVTFIMYRQLHFMHTKDLGFDYKNVFIINPQTEDMKEFILNVDKISEELSQHPSISGVLKQTYNFFDVHGGMRTSTHWADKVRERDYDTWISIIYSDYHFIDFFKIPLKEGRNFTKSFSTETQKVLIEDRLAKMIGNNAIGQHLIFYKDEYFEIAGIFENFEDQSLKNETLPKVIKLNNEYDPQFLYIRISGNNIPETLKYVGNVFKKHGIRDFESTSMESIFNNFSKDEDILMRFIGFVSVICLIISIFGIYSLTLYSMERRRREIAIRKVMGASANNIIRIFLKEYMWLVLIASVIAIPPAYYIMTNWLQAYANRISITWWLIAVIIIIVTAIVVITILRQIIKAANSNPAEVIKYE